MRYQGHNILAIVAAALVIYFLEFLLYGVLIAPDQFMTMSGMAPQQQGAGMARMALGPVMPLLAAIGLSLVIKWRAAIGPMGGLMTGVLMAVLFGFGSRMYGYVYGPHTETYLAIDFARYVVTYGIAGAIIGAWK